MIKFIVGLLPIKNPIQIGNRNSVGISILQPSYIDATLNEINKEYGSIDSYLRDGLGLSDEELTRLRLQLLEWHQARGRD